MGNLGGSHVPTSDQLAYDTLEDWFDAVTSFMGTEEELYDLLDRFEAWVRIQKKLFRIAAKVLIFCVRKEFEKRKMELEKRKEEWEKRREEGSKEKRHKERGGAEEKKYPKSKGEASGEDRGTTAPASGVTKPREKGPGEIVWTSPQVFDYQTTPSPGYENAPHVNQHKNEVYGIETGLTAKFGKGYTYKGSGGGWEKCGRPELKEAVDRFRAALSNVYGYDKDLPFDSCYRPLGTDVPDEKAVDGKGDPGGKRDARDARGHWTGESIDLHTKYVRNYFGIPDSEKDTYNFLDEIGKAVGLKRSWLSIEDGVHWTYCSRTRKTYPKIIIDGVTYGGQETNP